MQPASNVGHLKTADWESVQDLVTRFEDACQGGDIAKLEQFLPPEGNPVRLLALNELIKSDLEIHWARHRQILLEDYLKRFRELEAHPNHWPKLLYEEYRVRWKFGDRPVLADYQRRFPEQFRALEKILADYTLSAAPSPQARTPDAEDAGLATIAHSPGPEPATRPPEPKQAAAETAVPGVGRAPPDVGNGYKLISFLGSGTYGEVWRAEAPGGVPAAVKILFRPYDHEEAQRELQSLEKIKALRHPFLTATQAFWQAGGRLCIAMELTDGSLRDRARECRAAEMAGVPVRELLDYFKDAAEALDYLHEQDLLHRDIKPDNLLLVKPAARAEAGHDRSQRTAAAPSGVRSHLKLGDFGLVRTFESQRMQATTAGTPAYMPPEVWSEQVSKHSDQYSLAITYAELRRGKPVFAAKNMYELMHELGKDPNLSGLEPDEQVVLRKALDKDPARRYESCWDFACALEQALVPPAPPQPVPTRRLLPMLLALAACVLIGFLVYQFVPANPVVVPVIAGAEHPPDATPQPEGDHWYYDKIDVVREGTRFRFLLIPRKAGKLKGVSTFYILANKVSVGQFKVFAKTGKAKDKRWNEPGDVGGDYPQDDYPVFNVLVDDAYEFARWLGGNLPTIDEWDIAAGRYEKPRGEGPYQGHWDEEHPLNIAVRRKREMGPMRCADAKDDESTFHCHDMAGNGREWTRNLDRNGWMVPVPNPDPLLDNVLLRGQSFIANMPLQFHFQDHDLPTAFYKEPRFDIGFRVVIDQLN